jgi:serine/threonine protein kinase
MVLAPGTRLGAHDLVALIGAGGMGEVYRARDTKLGRDVALKILPESFTHDPERLARFRREAQVLASLNHPHIGAIDGLDEANGQQFLVLELVDGESLDRRIARGPILVDEALAIARQIAEALEAAHERGIMHRDLKPANIALTKDGAVKVLDFGLAKATDPASGPSFDVTHSPTITSPAMMTGVGVILGTAAYMSPEQARGKTVDKRADIWAFGLVLYEMLTGRRAFTGETTTDVLSSVVKEEPAWDGVPLPVQRLLKLCLEKDPKKRLRDIGDAWRLLEETAEPRPVRARHSWIPWTVAAALGVALGAALWAPWRTPSAAPELRRFRFP